MGALTRHGMRAFLAVLIVCGLGASVGVAEFASAASLPAASSATPGVPTSTIQGNTYCVSNYAPNSDVVVVNQLTGATSTIHTDANGSGCTTIPIRRACATSTTQTIVASGVGADGHPATSQVVDNAPPDPSLCVSPSPTTSPTVSPTPTTAATHCKPTKAILSVYIVPEGAQLRGHACGFNPGESVFVYLHSAPVFVGSTVAASDGIAAKNVSIPTCIAPGQHEFLMVGQSSGNVATATFTVTKDPSVCNPSSGAGGGSVQPVGANSGGSGGSGGGTLAFTGADILAMVLVALILLVLGITTVLAVRRRRTAPTA